MTAESLISLSEREYYSKIADFLEAGLLYNSGFYSWIIKNMYEIFDKDKETLQTLLTKYGKIKKTIDLENPFINPIIEYFETTYSYGEAKALALVLSSFISWKMNLIEMGEYYEIRDMFVPFNLPISVEADRIDDLYAKILDCKPENFILFNRIGGGFTDTGVSNELIKEALNELNYTPED